MYKKKGDKKNIIIVLAICFILFLVVIIVNMFHKRDLNFLERFFKDTEVFVSKIVYAPISYVKDKIDTSKSKKQLLAENKRLKKKLNQVPYNEAKLEELRNEVNALKKQLKLESLLGEKNTLHATVINRHTDGFYQTINIDKGIKNGIQKGMAIVSEKGLLGIVDKTGNYSSTVSLLTSDTFDKISVRIKVEDHYVYGLLSGYKEKRKIFILEGISDTVDIPTDAVVTTTGMGKTFPAGLLVGKVKKVTTDNFDLAKIVEVKPAADFENIDYIAAVKRDQNYDR